MEITLVARFLYFQLEWSERMVYSNEGKCLLMKGNIFITFTKSEFMTKDFTTFNYNN